MQETNTQPSKEVFNANITSVGQVPTPPLEIDKKQIIEKVGGKKNFLSKKAFLVIGVFFVLIMIVFLGSLVLTKFKGSQKVKITWWSLEEDSDAVSPLIKAYEKDHPNVTIDFVKEDQQDYEERLVSALSSNGPDIFEFHNSWVPVFAGSLVPVENDFSSTFYPVVTSDLRTAKGYLGVPLEYNGIALFVNDDILRSYGKVAPKTWDDLRSTVRQLTVRDSNGNIKQSGVAMGVTSNVDYWQDIFALLMLQNGADLKTPNTTSGQSALTFYTDFSKVDKVWDDTLPTSTQYFTSGNIAMYFGSYNEVFNIRKQNPNLHFSVVPLPQLPSNGGAASNISYASYWVNGVSNKSVNKEQAWDFLKFMITASSLRELYKNEVGIRGYGNLYPRVDMQKELLSDHFAGPFIYQADFAKSWYIASNTFNGASGINSQLSKVYSDAIGSVNTSLTADQALSNAQTALTQMLSSYRIVPMPSPTP